MTRIQYIQIWGGDLQKVISLFAPSEIKVVGEQQDGDTLYFHVKEPGVYVKAFSNDSTFYTQYETPLGAADIYERAQKWIETRQPDWPFDTGGPGYEKSFTATCVMFGGADYFSVKPTYLEKDE